jgi:hypothetical protein
MAKLNQMFPSKWLAASDLDDSDRTLTVRDVTQEIVGQGEEAESKYVVYFRETEKGLVLNKTNATSLGSCLGDDTDDWVGQRVVLYPTQVQFNSKMVDAIRVKEKATKVANKAAKPSTSRQTAPPVTQAEVDGDDGDGEDIPF